MPDETVDRLAAAELQQFESAGEFLEVWHEELAEHRRRKPGRLLGFQVSVPIGGSDRLTLGDVPAGNLIAEERAAGAVPLVAVVIDRQQALLLGGKIV